MRKTVSPATWPIIWDQVSIGSLGWYEFDGSACALKSAPPNKDELLSRVWVAAFSRALFESLACPDGNGTVEVRRYRTHIEYLSFLVSELSKEGASPSWEYADAVRDYQSCSGLVSAFLAREPSIIEPLLLHLHSERSLDPLLAQLDEVRLEEIVRALTLSGTSKPSAVKLLITVAEACSARSTSEVGAFEAIARLSACGHDWRGPPTGTRRE